MKNTFKRIAVIAMAVLMCVSAVVPAFAAGNACPGEGNTHTAYNCTYVEANKQEATCEAAGFVTGKCTTCQTVFTVSQTEALDHDFDAVVPAVCGSKATKTCKVCEYVEEIGTELKHLYTAWTLSEGTCEVGARITKTCVYCGEPHEDSPKFVSDEGHEFELVAYVEPANCVDNGVAKYACAVAGCNATKEVEIRVDDEAAHDWDEVPAAKDKNLKAATCTTTGRKSLKCSVCETVVVVATPLVPHNEKNLKSIEEKKPTCTTAGNIAYQQCRDCKVCFVDGEEVELADVKLDAYHDVLAINGVRDVEDVEDQGYEVFLPSCTTAGTITYSCPVCAETTEEFQNVDVALPKYENHVYYNDVKTIEQKRVLLVALDLYTEEAVEELSDASVERIWAALGEVKVIDGKNYNAVWFDYTPATCDKNATVTYRCLNCTFDYRADVNDYVMVECEVATETVLTGEGYEKLGHAYAETYRKDYKGTYTASDFAGEGETAEGSGVYYAYTWLKEALCGVSGRKKSYCVNEFMNDEGEYELCKAEEVSSVPALEHDWKVLEATDFVPCTKNHDGDEDTDEVCYVVDGVCIIENAKFVTCQENGSEYKVCTECNKKDITEVVSKGDEHVWNYLYNGEEYETAEEVYAAAEVDCETTVKAYRFCKFEDCSANEHKQVTLEAKGHDYGKTDVKYVRENWATISALNSKNAYVAGTCEKGASYKIYCKNGCGLPTTVADDEGFAAGHIKTYIPNTAIASTCTVAGTSNRWYCGNDKCEYYAFYNATGALVSADGTELVSAAGVPDMDEIKSVLDKAYDTLYGTTHQIYNEKTEKWVDVDYKAVPDANISGAKTVELAKKVEAPVVDGKVVNYVAIEGTSLLWVYAYADEDHRTADVTTGGFYCACGNFGGSNKVVFDTQNEASDCDYDDVKVDASCESVGYTVYTCPECFDSYITGFEPAIPHAYYVISDNDEDSDTYGDILDYDDDELAEAFDDLMEEVAAAKKSTDADEKAWAEKVVAEGLAHLAPTCTKGGYIVDACQNCDKVTTITVKALGHENNKGQALTTSCLNTAYPRKCDTCGVTVNKAHAYDAAGICQECGETR